MCTISKRLHWQHLYVCSCEELTPHETHQQILVFGPASAHLVVNLTASGNYHHHDRRGAYFAMAFVDIEHDQIPHLSNTWQQDNLLSK